MSCCIKDKAFCICNHFTKPTSRPLPERVSLSASTRGMSYPNYSSGFDRQRPEYSENLRF